MIVVTRKIKVATMSQYEGKRLKTKIKAYKILGKMIKDEVFSK